jgi:choline dehydrogenase-like flavoprotein
MSTTQRSSRFDAIVIGTGFAGAVTACRLVEAGFRICILERGRRYGPDDFPRYPTEDLLVEDGERTEQFKPPPDFSRWLWSRDQGLFDIRDLDDVASVQAAGYGGGSLVYTSVHLRPPREVFNEQWPTEYRPDQETWVLDDYFDLAAYMLQVTPIPKQLAKTIRLMDVAGKIGPANHWFRPPLAVTFGDIGTNMFGRPQQSCDMRGRCWLGCDRSAKNTLDVNYLARAEEGEVRPDIRTLAEVKTIVRRGTLFTVTYEDLVFREVDVSGEPSARPTSSVEAEHVFLCAGALNTTELLLKNWEHVRTSDREADDTPLGSRYFPNADSLAAVFGCDQPHEADYGPTITAALLYKAPANDDFSCSVDFCEGRSLRGIDRPPVEDVVVTGATSGAVARLAHAPLMDRGRWDGSAAGALILTDIRGQFQSRETIRIGEDDATATLCSSVVQHGHWFMLQDGGYPSDLEGLAGIFRSPLWLRRNRYLESAETRPAAPPRRPHAQRIQLKSFSDSVLATARHSAPSARGVTTRSFDSTGIRITRLLSAPLTTFFPEWFTTALMNDRLEFMDRGAALALPLLSRLLGDISKTLASQTDSATLSQLLRVSATDDQAEVLIRGMLRQALQALAGSEAAIATKAAKLLLNPVPSSAEQLLDRLGTVLLWALAYRTADRHTGVVLTMGRDRYRGRLRLQVEPDRTRRLVAQLPGRLPDVSGAVQERILREIARDGWKGELRTNPVWTTFGKRVTVHSQGGSPMGEPGLGVTSALGEVHECPGLYVMDAAAFPTSVGVNPSATIAAVAEFKIEQFIRRRRPGWSARDKADARAWVEQSGRSRIDPLNLTAMQDNGEPAVPVIGLTFRETMLGFVSTAGGQVDFDNLEKFPNEIMAFTRGEAAGIAAQSVIEVELNATARDLGRVISPEPGVAPAKIDLTGVIRLGRDRRECPVERESFLQLFVKPPASSPERLRFFRYRLDFLEGGRKYRLAGLKMLRDAPGFDMWSDTSTLYVEIRPADGIDDGARSVRHGIVRIPIERFLADQLSSFDVTGTDDAARKSWALAAFYRYFAGELLTVYMDRAGMVKHLLTSLLTGIHV